LKKVSALGLDIGNKRIGVAGCDKLGLLATRLTTVKRSSFTNDLAIFQNLVQEREATILVVGLPYAMDGTLGKQALQTQKYAQKLAQSLNLPLEYVDERFTSLEAEDQLKNQKRFNSRDKGMIDQVAAQIILQTWLDD
jgi:putative holliday junction resolvase